MWTHGHNTEFEARIAGESRTIVVTSEAIEDYLALDPDGAASMSPEERVNFVSDNLPLFIAAANRKIDPIDRAADLITIRTGEI
ncbi:MAG: hypothetical protein ABI853_01230 [Sphingomicrobium sp.]